MESDVAENSAASPAMAAGGGNESKAPAALAGNESACVTIDVGCADEGVDDWNDGKAEEVCRICHLSSERKEQQQTESIQLGCECKGDLGVAHRPCAEAWFRIKGNRYCEICGANAKNISGVEDGKFMLEWRENHELRFGSSSDRCWRRQPFCNFLMACLVIAFLLPWFFRVNLF